MSASGQFEPPQWYLAVARSRSLTEQMAGLLLDEAVDGRVSLPQRTLAAMLGAQRPSLNKILKAFERDGLIDVRYVAIDILDPDGLHRNAG